MIIIVMGVAGAGKSTVGQLLAQKLNCDFLDADDFHPPENRLKMQTGVPLTDEDRVPWLARLAEIIQQYQQAQKTLVLACSLLRESYRKQLGVDQQTIRTVYLKGTREQFKQRLQKRKHAFFNPDLLDSQLQTLEEPVGGLTLSIEQLPQELVDRICASLP